MKMIFVVVTQTINGKNYAFADTIKTVENLSAYIARYGSNICHLCESRKQAEEIAYEWNESYKKNGTSIFEEVTPA